MIKKIMLLTLATYSIYNYANEIIYVPNEISCNSSDIKSCFSAEMSLCDWELKPLTTVKPGTYIMKKETLRAASPNNPYHLPITYIVKNHDSEIEVSYKKMICVRAHVMLDTLWKIKNEIAYCMTSNSHSCPLIEF